MPEYILSSPAFATFYLVSQPPVLQLLPLPYQPKKWQDIIALVQHGEEALRPAF